jgi:hypothetical protein
MKKTSKLVFSSSVAGSSDALHLPATGTAGKPAAGGFERAKQIPGHFRLLGFSSELAPVNRARRPHSSQRFALLPAGVT